MAKTAQAEDLVLEAIQRALADPTPRKLHGTKANPGIFLASSAAAKAAAQQCLERGLIVPCGEQRTKSKSVPLYGIASAGVSYLLEHDPLRQLLTATEDGVSRLARTSADCQQTLAGVQEQVARLQEVVQHAASRLQPPDVQKMLAAVQAARGAGGSPIGGSGKLREGGATRCRHARFGIGRRTAAARPAAQTPDLLCGPSICPNCSASPGRGSRP